MTHMTNMRQRGSALTIAILLLLLLTLAVFVAVPAMLGEQRVSGNDVRAKIAHHVAEAGLNHTREFLRLNQLSLIPEAGVPTSTALWAACASTDRSFPCGTVEPDATNSTVRSNHYRYIGGADGRTVTFTPGRIYDGTGTDAGNFDASYDAGILLCRLKAPIPPATSSTCTLTSALAVGTSMFTLVSRGAVTGEGTTATVSETIGTFRLINAPPNLPPLMAAGSVTGLGSSTIVGNPNAGGFGVPLSVWARNNFDGSGGSWQTCQLDEYLRSSLGDVVMEGKNKNVPTCDDCDCSPGNQLSGSRLAVEGIDILDSTDADGGKAKAGTSYYFPCDMFQHVFGIQARTDENRNGVCETPKLADGDPTLPDVQEWLTANAQIMTCAGLNSAGDKASGLVWIQSSCGPGDSLDTEIGSADNPVFLVIDGSLKLNTAVKFFGMIFLRHTGDGFENCVSTGAGCPEVLSGGGSAQVYGSIIMEGGGKLNGTIDLVYVPQIIINFTGSPGNNSFAGLPGSWSDRVSY